jgi:phosphate transport system permease protein
MLERIATIIIRIAGYITALVVLLIAFFLIKESVGIVNEKIIDDGYTLVVNEKNSIDFIPSEQIKEIFDAEITNWNEITQSFNIPITLLTLDNLEEYVDSDLLEDENANIPQIFSQVISNDIGMLALVPTEYISQMSNVKTLDEGKIDVIDIFAGSEWLPTAFPSPQFGILPLLIGTLWVTLASILIAFPVGVAVAVYISEYSKRPLKPLIEMIAGIPSVVFGFVGLTIVVPFIRAVFDIPTGETILAGAIVLSFMLLPTIISITEDSLRAIPTSLREASLALGASQTQTIIFILLPAAKSGIFTALLLAIGRAFGETMAILMVTGNAAIIPTSVLEPVRTIPATIAAELGETAKGTAHYEILFLLAAILFLTTFVINLLIGRRQH